MLLVDGMVAARRFYCDVIGCVVDNALPQYGMLQLRAGAALIDLVDIASAEGAWARPPAAGGRNIDHVCLATGRWDEAAMRAHLAAHHVEIVEEGIRYGARGDGPLLLCQGPVRQHAGAQGALLATAPGAVR